MSDDLSRRAQDAAERFLEDESLTEDLTDEQARPLISWLTKTAQEIALDTARDDDNVNAELKRLRAAVKLSCKAPEELSADDLISLVQQHLTDQAATTRRPEEHMTIDELKRLTKAEPGNAAAWLKLGDAHLRAGDTQSSIGAQLEAAKLFEASSPMKAIQILKMILAISPNHRDCQERLARLQAPKVE